MSDEFASDDVVKDLDSAGQNIIVCGSVYENFGQSRIKILNDNDAIDSSLVFGMPTWTGMNGVTGANSDKIQIVITSPYNYLRGGAYLDTLSENYKALFYSRPSDMVLKGYETMYHFTKLFLAYRDVFINNV